MRLEPSNHAGLRCKVGRFYDQGRENPFISQALADVLGNEMQGSHRDSTDKANETGSDSLIFMIIQT